MIYQRASALPGKRRLRAQLRRTDVLLASFPRSGNTWLRFLLADLIVEGQEAFPTDIVELNKVICDYHKGLGEPRLLPHRIVKVHEPHPGTPHRFVALVRRPEDALVSYFHYHRLHDNLIDRTQAGIDQFVRASLSSWIWNVQSYLDATNSGHPGILATYEDLSTSPESTVKSICDFIGISATSQQISAAVERRTFRRLRQAEGTRTLHPTEAAPPIKSEKFFRKGEVGSGKAELTHETVEFIIRRTEALYDAVAQMASDAAGDG